MIKKASELLEAFIASEKEKLKGIDMKHMPTLGSAYEEITKQGVDSHFAIPKHLDLQVVSGFISIAGEMLPEQIDCMLVHGDGKKYGLTAQFIYEIDQVLCIFEVKKTLRKSDYLDAFDHLKKIRTKYAAHFENLLRSGSYEPNISLARMNFSRITGKAAPERYLEIHNLSKPDGILFYSLVQETLAPISIIHGYEGYKTEAGLRTIFLDILSEKNKAGAFNLGTPSLPTLVTSNNFCLIKNNGMPFLTFADNSWIVTSSTRHNPVKIMLEMIWSKISFYFDIHMPWDDNLDIENTSPLLIAEAKETEEGAAWLYKSIELPEKNLVRDEYINWHPAAITAYSLSASNIMMLQGGYLPLDSDMNEYMRDSFSVTIEDLEKNLLSTGYFMKEGDFIRPIAAQTFFLTEDDDTGLVANDREKFDLWCQQNNKDPYYTVMIFLGES
jgi:hypothetical protein